MKNKIVSDILKSKGVDKNNINFPITVNDNKGNVIYIENANGYWVIHEFDENNIEIYSVDSNNIIVDNRPLATNITIEQIKTSLNITGDINIIE